MQIHELNNFVGALGASAYLPIDNGQDTGKLAFSDLFVGDSAETLWSGSQVCKYNNKFNLSEAVAGYQFLDIYYKTDAMVCNHFLRVPTSESTIAIQVTTLDDSDLVIEGTRISIEAQRLAVGLGYRWENGVFNDNEGILDSNITITRIDGIATPGNSKGVIAVKQVTLAAADWSTNTQTVTVSDLRTTDNVIISPDPTAYGDYTDAGVHCTAVGTNALTFVCDTTPTTDLLVNVMVVG